MANADALDESWGRVTPAAALAAGIKVICGYLSLDPSKNISPSDIRGYHAAGIGVVMNWESNAAQPLRGALSGDGDALEAIRQVRALYAAVGYQPRSKIGVIFSCDTNTSPTQYPMIDAYYQHAGITCHNAGLLCGAYGEFDLIEHLAASGLVDVRWQTLAWSNGYISQSADLYQSSINNTVGGVSVDLDQIRHQDHLGVWWPPGHPLDIEDDTLTQPQIDQLKFDLEEWLAEHVQKKLDQSAYAILQSILPAVAQLVPHILNIDKTTGATLLSVAAAPPGAIDVAALAKQLAPLVRAELGTLSLTGEIK